jgi:hypothetical protein
MAHNPTPAMLSVMRALAPTDRYLAGTAAGFRLHGRRLPPKRDVSQATAGKLIEVGYIGRQDQRARYHLTELGKIILADHEEGRDG